MAKLTPAQADKLRPLTAAEHRRLGLAPTKRLYTWQASGVKALRADATVSRRTHDELRIDTTLEKRAQVNRERAGGRLPTDTYYRTVRRYAEKHGLTVGEARSSPEFKAMYRDLRHSGDSRRSSKKRVTGQTTQRERARSARRLKALYDLGEIDYDTYQEYLTEGS